MSDFLCLCEVNNPVGFVKLCDFHRSINDASVARIREQIAQQIETIVIGSVMPEAVNMGLGVQKQAIRIARGNNE